MAFDLNAAGGYGTGALGDYNLDNLTPLVINWSANATALTDTQNGTSTLTLANIIIGSNDNLWRNIGFNVGTEVLLFVDGEPGGTGLTSADAMNFVGRWIVAKITASNIDELNSAGTITVNKDLSAFADAFYSDCVLKVVNIPHMKDVTLNAGSSIAPTTQGYPVVFKCSGTLTFNGGHINLKDFGNSSQLRPLLNQENNGTVDTDKYAGWENSATKDRFVMNTGDGAAFIIANNITVTNDESRIGNPETYGVQYCRGAAGSYGKPSKVTNLGGSTILICAGTFTDFTPKLIAKYRSGAAGSGLARCYIASGTRLTNDEGLYAYDNISNPSVVTDTLKIKSFGDGSNGASTSSVLWSNFAAVVAFDKTRKVVTVKNMTTDGTVQFAPGSLVMVHAKNKDSTNTKNVGRFFLATILGVNGNDITLDTAAPYNTFNTWLSNYYVQIITIPQFTNFKPSKDVGTQIPSWNDANGYGGIFAIAVNNTCDLSGRVVSVMGKGGGAAYGRNGLTHIGNAQNYGRLPVGQGHGSVFILAKNLAMDADTRIGATYSGAVSSKGFYGGAGGNPKGGAGNYGGGYQGVANGSNGGGRNGAPGQGAKGGDNVEKDGIAGGYGSNGYLDAKIANTSPQGAHVMIVADTITGFNQAAISTGGGGATEIMNAGSTPDGKGHGGSAGYGGGGASTHGGGNLVVKWAYGGEGGYNGGGSGGKCGTCESSYGAGGGAAGWAFIYCNNVVDQDTTDTVVD